MEDAVAAGDARAPSASQPPGSRVEDRDTADDRGQLGEMDRVWVTGYFDQVLARSRDASPRTTADDDLWSMQRALLGHDDPGSGPTTSASFDRGDV